MRNRRILSLGLVPLVGCTRDSSLAVTCTDIALPGLGVSVVDAGTRLPLDQTALVVARTAAFADTARVSDQSVYWLLTERPGTYTVSVSAPGYALWQRNGVIVSSDRCHVRTVELTAPLQR